MRYVGLEIDRVMWSSTSQIHHKIRDEICNEVNLVIYDRVVMVSEDVSHMVEIAIELEDT